MDTNKAGPQTPSKKKDLQTLTTNDTPGSRRMHGSRDRLAFAAHVPVASSVCQRHV